MLTGGKHNHAASWTKLQSQSGGASCHTQREKECRMGTKSEQWWSAALDLHSKHYNCTGFSSEAMTQHRQGHPAGWGQVRGWGGGAVDKPRAAPTLAVEQMARHQSPSRTGFGGGSGSCRGSLWCTESAKWSRTLKANKNEEAVGGGCACELKGCAACSRDVGVKLRPLVVITPSVLLSLFLQVLQLCLVHHLLHQVFFPPHTIAEILRHVGNEVSYEGLDPKHQVLREH